MVNFKTFTFTARKNNWNILLILFVWYMKAEPRKKTHLDIYPAYFYILLPHYKSPSFITCAHSLWSYFFCLSKHSSCFSYSQSRLVLCVRLPCFNVYIFFRIWSISKVLKRCTR